MGCKPEPTPTQFTFPPSINLARFAPQGRRPVGFGDINLATSVAAKITGKADKLEAPLAVRRRGLNIVIPPGLVTHTCGEDTLAALVDHEIRWARTVRRIDPPGYAGSGITHPLPLALIAAAALGFSPISISLVFAILVMRVGSKFRIDAITGSSAGPWWLVPASDMLSFIVFLASFLSNTVVWQGRRFRVGRDGVLSNL